MKRSGGATGACLLGLLAVLGGCYALPERHSVSNEPAEGEDGGAEGNGHPDAGASMDAATASDGGVRDGGRDAANGCDCDLERPVCIERTKTCVACSADDLGVCKAGELCDVLHGECVGCLQNSDCKNPKQSVCDGVTHQCTACDESDESSCSHIAGKQVCLAGECVQCTKDALAACVVQQSPTKSVQNVCSALNHTCTTREIGKTAPCGECVSDAECRVGHVCVGMEFGGQPITGRSYCLPVREGLNCEGDRPYTGLSAGQMTIDGEMHDVCTLRISTCRAQAQYQRFCGLDELDRPIGLNDAGMPSKPSVKGDNSLCGLPQVDDGYCIQVQPGAHRCTVACSTTVGVGDCPIDAPSCGPATHASGMRELCAIP